MRAPLRLLLVILVAAGIGPAAASPPTSAADGGWSAGRISSLPSLLPTAPAFPPGLHWLEVGAARKAALFVPTGIEAGTAAPLVILLHGAGGNPSDILPLMRGAAEAEGFLLLAPHSQGDTWDFIRGGYGPDVEALDRALGAIRAAHKVDPDRIAIGGFSDGASYALSLGLTNGDVFGDILAFSPGFMAPASLTGQPRVFISHGTEDSVLPIDRCSRRIAPTLRGYGYDVDYREFPGPHVVPPEMVAAAVRRFLADRRKP